MKVFLIGYRAAGKTAVGRLLSRKLKIPFADTDQMVEAATGMPIKDLVAREGWDAFRKKETEAIASLHGAGLGVVATGGGAVLSEANRIMLKEMGSAIYLKAPSDRIVERLQRDAQGSGVRPQFTAGSLEDETRAMLALRIPVYEAAADFTVDTNGKGIVQVKDEIYQLLLNAGLVADIDQRRKQLRRKQSGGSKNGR
ncbi:MAG: shikimate kinase [Deltaproteobacteria bacterium]|nr:shikimate kinase [Deltaproteobacteria bacterium]